MICIIAAVADNGVIGKNGRIPWNIPEDLKNFKNLTTGNTVIMGRKTWESLPAPSRPLPRRHNIVISRSINMLDGALVSPDLESAITKGKEYGASIFIIGGESVYKEGLKFADILYISHVKGAYEGDAYFPAFSAEDWALAIEEEHDKYVYRVYKRKRNI